MTALSTTTTSTSAYDVGLQPQVAALQKWQMPLVLPHSLVTVQVIQETMVKVWQLTLWCLRAQL